ncbi:hypothetical protein [Leptospira meyeri]|uniref:hypothetical protein n=1 Tax=Leptospira meyeri TaxID=29508 RepID=UPI00223D59E2|nr:hypothetical protein [Leptospira meyeri]MCW7487598.1 hypothetical protein [Leptospira meyeri]
MSPAKFFRIAILVPLFLFQACIPSLSKGLMQSVSDFLQLRSLVNTGPYKISFTVSGLLGSGLVIGLNSGTETINVNADGNFEFTTTLTTGSNFNVSIKTQPTLPTQVCSVSGGMGVVGFGNVTSIMINCDPLKYTIGGTITGLDGITGLVLTNSVDGSTLNVAVASGTFAFTQTYLDGTTYNVSVTTQPNHPVQNCLTTNGAGAIAGANVTNITIACTSIAFPIEVTAVGIASGTLTLRNNNSEYLSISANGLQRFPTNIVTNNSYSLQIVSTPAGHQCTLSSTTGVVTGNIAITANCFSVLSIGPSNGGVLKPLESIKLQFSDEINAGSCTGSTGTLNTNLSLAIQFTVSTTNFANDTLTVTPAATDSWMSGHKTLTLNCNSVSGYPLSSTVNILYLIPSNLRYVADNPLGVDANDGLTPLTPKRNIQLAINSFGGCPAGDCAVLVEGGSYDPAFVGGTIQLVSGISLYGGYVPGSSFATWDPNSHSSVILMDTTPAGCAVATATSPCASITGDATVTNNVTISGFTIEGGPDTAPFMAGVFLDSTDNVRLINNVISAGYGINGSYGVLANNSNPYLILNRIDGGKCTVGTCPAIGLSMASTSPISPILLTNSISGGSSATISAISKGIQFSGTSTITVSNIRGNEIVSKDLDTSAGASTLSVAFDVTSGASAGSNGTLAGNLLTAGQGSQSVGMRIQVASAIEIGSPTQGNIIISGNGVTNSHGIYLSAGGHVVRRNLINIGKADNLTGNSVASGIYVTGGGTSTIENNTIEGGKVTSSSTASLYGIKLNSPTATSRIAGNYIRLGTSTGVTTSTTTAGINLDTPFNALIANNWIQNGPDLSSYNSFGIEVIASFSGLRIYHNSISGGATSVAGKGTPIFLKTPTNSADIQNNILLLTNDISGNACIINSGPGIQTAIKYNVFHHCNELVSQNGTSYTELCGGGIPSTATCVSPIGILGNFGNNLKLDPKFVSDFGTIAVYTPTSATSCLITKSSNLLIADSINGNGTRPGGDGAVSLGAVEYEFPCTP